MKSNKEALQQRGFIGDIDISLYLDISEKDLLKYLNSQVATERSIAAKIIALKKDATFIDHLVNALSKETKLYSKIAISESLSQLGIQAVKALIPFLGKIGNNQYKTLPSEQFLKNNYPLPRDIVARTICKIGSKAISILIKEFSSLQKNIHQTEIPNHSAELNQLSEAIDAIGYISYYTKNISAKEYLLKLLDQYKENSLITWKLIRALQSFPDKDVIKYLKNIINSTTIKQHKWEAQRSLDKITEAKKLL